MLFCVSCLRGLLCVVLVCCVGSMLFVVLLSVWFILLSDIELSFDCLLVVVVFRFFFNSVNLDLFDFCDFFTVFIDIFS